MGKWADIDRVRSCKWTTNGQMLVSWDIPSGWFAVWIGRCGNKITTIAYDKPTQTAAKSAATRWYRKHYGEEV